MGQKRSVSGFFTHKRPRIYPPIAKKYVPKDNGLSIIINTT